MILIRQKLGKMDLSGISNIFMGELAKGIIKTQPQVG